MIRKHGKLLKNIILPALCLLMTMLPACSRNTSVRENTPETEVNTSEEAKTSVSEEAKTSEEGEIIKTGSLELSYATQFSVDYYSKGYKHIHIEDGNEYVIVPEGMEENDLGFEGATIISGRIDNIYLAASSAMDLFMQLDSLDKIKACSTKAEDYAISEVREKVESGDIAYAGKYSAPDYELLLSLGSSLAVESTMIYHTPDVKEQLEKLGIPVIVERSSYEHEPLGRLEWIKLYAVLLGKEQEADAYFEEQKRAIEELAVRLAEKEDGPKEKVAFFYVSANGYINVRKPDDYLSKMIGMAGGDYALKNISFDEDNALSTININWEDFYREAKDADILIYNGTVDGGIRSVEELISKNELFSDFKAVKSGNVWCTNMNLFQETSKVKAVVEDFYAVIYKTGEQPEYLYKVN